MREAVKARRLGTGRLVRRVVDVGGVCLAMAAGAGCVPGAAAQGGVATQVVIPRAAPAVSGFTVTGRVLCGDTQRPARFAQVMLLPADEDQGGGGRGRRLTARTDLDGNFSLGNVQPGDYFVTGQMAGYVNQSAEVEAALSAGGDTGQALPGVPEVHVSAGGASTQLTLQRGGVLAGTVLWDDGTPAGGVQVSVQPAQTSSGGSTQMQAPGFGRMGIGGGAFGFMGFGGGMTDDRGNFRLTGLAPGSYLLRASVQAPMPSRPGEAGFTRTMNLSVYAPNKMRRTDATAITLAAGEERDDVTVTLGLAGLHSVSGIVSSTTAAVRSGSVNLTDQTDSSLNRTGMINSDGSFAIQYVPPGNYTLRVNASASAAGGFGRGGGGVGASGGASAVRFQPLQESVTVVDSDLTGLTLNVTAATTSTQ